VFTKIKHRLASEQGFTLIELLVVIVILGILAAIAVPSYLSFRGKAQSAANEANVRSAIPAAESYYQTNNSYSLLSGAELRTQAPGISPNDSAVSLNGGQGYCLQADDGGTTHLDPYSYIGGNPGTITGSGTLATIEPGTCAAEAGTAAS